MNIFIAGATGVLGRRVVKQCIDAGHSVAGLSRSGENDTVLSTLGAEPRRGDFFDAASLRNIIAGCDVVMHLATAIPKKILVRKGDWLLNDRLRTEKGTRNLAEAALANACRPLICSRVSPSFMAIMAMHGSMNQSLSRKSSSHS